MKSIIITISLLTLAILSSLTAKKNNLNPANLILANHFNYPVGSPDGKGYYNAQPFGKNNHLGDDWNGNGGGNSDLGDTIYAVANGYINSAKDLGGSWGNIIRITHYLSDQSQVESIYAHCNEILVDSGNLVGIGTPIGTIGTANGKYPAHLHFEMRSDLNLPIGGGYSLNKEGYLDPTAFIKAHR